MTDPSTNNAQAELVGRLKKWAEWVETDFDVVERDLLLEAAAEIERMAGEIARLERNRDMWKGQCERQAKHLAAFRNRPIVDQDGKEVGRDCTCSTSVEAFTDENGTVWTPPTAYAYAAVCKANERKRMALHRLREIFPGWTSERIERVRTIARQALSPSVGEDHPPITTDGRRG